MAQKKSFMNNLSPALQFISATEEENTAINKKEIPDGYKLNPLYIEKRSKRLQLLMQPSLYNELKTLADKEQCSVNDLIHRALEEFIKGE